MTRIHVPAALAAVIVAARLAASAEAVYELPRAESGVAVKGRVDCLEPGGCRIASRCGTPDEWEADPEIEPPGARGTMDHRHVWFVAGHYESLHHICRFAVEGHHSAWAYLEHSVGQGGPVLSRERVQLSPTATGPTARPGDAPDATAPGVKDCHPASPRRGCPDEEHVDDRCERQAVAYAYMRKAHCSTCGLIKDLVDNGLDKGRLVRFEAMLGSGAVYRGCGKWTTWTWEHGNAIADDAGGCVRRDQRLTYRAPQAVGNDTWETIRVTLNDEPGYCATTTLKFRINDTDD